MVPVAPNRTFPFDQKSYFTWPAAVTALDGRRAQWLSSRRLTDITGHSPLSATRDRAVKIRKGGLAQNTIRVSGLLGSSVETGGMASSLKSTITLDAVLVDVDRFTLTKRWPLVEVSGRRPFSSSYDSTYKSAWGVPTYYLSFEGEAYDTDSSLPADGGRGPILDTETDAVELYISTCGTIEFAEECFFDSVSHRFDSETGGRPRARFAGRYSGVVTYDQGTRDHDLSWLFIAPASVDDKPPRGTFTWLSGQQRTGTAMVYEISLSFDKSAGGAVQFSALAREDSTI